MLAATFRYKSLQRLAPLFKIAHSEKIHHRASSSFGTMLATTFRYKSLQRLAPMLLPIGKKIPEELLTVLLRAPTGPNAPGSMIRREPAPPQAVALARRKPHGT
jgi:hypothetical protein